MRTIFFVFGLLFHIFLMAWGVAAIGQLHGTTVFLVVIVLWAIATTGLISSAKDY